MARAALRAGRKEADQAFDSQNSAQTAFRPTVSQITGCFWKTQNPAKMAKLVEIHPLAENFLCIADPAEGRPNSVLSLQCRARGLPGDLFHPNDFSCPPYQGLSPPD